MRKFDLPTEDSKIYKYIITTRNYTKARKVMFFIALPFFSEKWFVCVVYRWLGGVTVRASD